MLLLFTAAMATARIELLAGGAATLLLFYLLAGNPSPATLVLMIKRLRWLLLAILLVYGWWTPGDSLWPGATLSPTIDGLFLGLLRILALLAIVAAVHLLLQSTSREDLLTAIMQLIRPLTTRQMRERIAVRTLLSIEAVTQVQALASDVLREHPVTTRNFRNVARSSRLLYKHVLERAALAGDTVIEVNDPASPPGWQWIIPLAMGGVIFILV